MNNSRTVSNENKRVAISRQLLQDALLRLLAKKHIGQISVAELCREAQVNRSTFYRLYSIPNEVMEEILQTMITDINSRISFTEGARAENARMIYQYIYEHRDVFKVILRNYDYRINGMLEEKYYKMFLKEYGVLETEEKRRLMIAHLIAGGLAFTSKWLESDSPTPPEEIAEMYCTITNPPPRIRNT